MTAEAGLPLGKAPIVVIMVHGRNAGPANILDLVPKLNRPNVTYLAPAAAGRTWYPLGFMAEIEKNEPGISTGIAMLESLVARVEAAGVPRSRVVVLGFSQGACLTSEFAVRNASRFGGFIIFTGGLIGPPGTTWDQTRSFAGTPIFMGTGDPDSHVPVSRVNESAAILTAMGARVTKKIYPGRGHYVSDDEIAMAQALIDEVQKVRVVFGAGAIKQIPEELDSLGLTRALVVTTPGRSAAADEIRLILGGRLAGTVASAAQHVPIETVNAALAEVDRLKPDCIVAIGGGSAIGLAKAIAINRSIPVAAVPTTYAGSEMTGIYGITEAGIKRTGRDQRAAPRLVVYDPDLTLTLPAAESAASGMNAIAHAVEAIYAVNASALSVASGIESIGLLVQALPAVVANPRNLAARELAQRGAHAAGVALETGTMGLHHRICHVLGGTLNMPHARTHAALLPYVVRFNAPAAPEAMVQVAAALGTTDPVDGLFALNEALGITPSLGALGLRESDIDRVAEIVCEANYPNPRTVTVADVRQILRAAL